MLAVCENWDSEQVIHDPLPPTTLEHKGYKKWVSRLNSDPARELRNVIAPCHTVDQRMSVAGHSRKDVFRRSYQARNSGADVQGPYFFNEKRTIVNELLRSADIEFVENLEQTLPVILVRVQPPLLLPLQEEFP